MIVNIGNDFVQTNEMILNLAAKKTGLEPFFVIVPDRFTLQAERILLASTGKLLNTRVITFSMLYRIVSEELNRGEQITKVIDKTTAVLHLWKAIREVQQDLVWYKKSVSHYDFAEKIFNTINQIKSSCVDFDKLESVAKSAVAKKKFKDINTIYKKYVEIISNSTDTSGMLSYLIENIEHSVIIKGAEFFICGFENLSPARLQVLNQIIRHAKSVNIGASERELKEQLQYYPVSTINTKNNDSKTYTAKCETERHEVEVVARKVVELLNQGINPEEIVVLLVEFEKLAPIWETIFTKYNIPTNIDVGKKLSQTAEAKYIKDLLELAYNDSAENTVSVIYNEKSGLKDEVYNLENTIIKNNTRARYIKEVKKLKNVNDIVALCNEIIDIIQEEKLKDIFVKISSSMAGQSIPLRELISLYWTLCCATKISSIPMYVNRVLITSVDEWVATKTKYLFVANCTDENFPKGQDDNDILQQSDLVNTKITPTPSLQRERNYIHSKVVLSSAECGVMMSGTCENYLPVKIPRSKVKILDSNDNITVGKQLFFGSDKVRTTMIEKYYSCPYLNFIENGLRIKPREIYELKPNLIGSAIHDAIEHYFKNGSMQDAIDTAVKKIEYSCKPIIENLKKEIKFIICKLEDGLKRGKFKIHAIEQKIEKQLPCGMTLVGRVDRIDVAVTESGEKVFAVIDYKTGTVPSHIAKSIYLGDKMQLPIYASALSGLGKVAGAGYLSLAGGFATEQKNLEFKGFVDRDYAELFSPDMLNLKSQQFIDAPVIEKICQHANTMVDKAVNEICQGITTAQAVDKKLCEYCPVKSVCKNSFNDEKSQKIKFTFKDFSGGKNG